MATLIKRGKKWYVKYYDETGKQKWVKGFTDKSETSKLANKIENDKTAIERGYIDPAAERRKAERLRLVEDHISEYETALLARGSSDNHIAYTLADIRKCFAHCGVTHASDLTRAMTDKWVVSLVDDSPRTVNRRVGSVQAFLRHLREASTITEYVLHKYPKKKTKGTEIRKRRALTQAECKRLIEHAPDTRKTIYRFALLTGLRFGEISSMTPMSFNFLQKTVTVRANDAKNKNKDQTIPLSESLVGEIKKLIEGKNREDMIFAMPARTDAAKILRGDCSAAKIDQTHVDFHALRHTFITRLAEKNTHPKILQELARHSNIETTLTYYTHFRQDDERKAINLLVA